MPQSVFGGLSKDRAAASRAFSVNNPIKGDEFVMYHSDFDNGFDNWTDQWDGGRPYPPISLTGIAARSGRRSLMISTDMQVPYVSNSWANYVFANNRLSRQRVDPPVHSGDYRFVTYSAWCAVGTLGFAGAWADFGLLIDTNSYDNSQRSIFRLVVNKGNTTIRYRTKITTTSDGNSSLIVTGGDGLWIGDNDNKLNFGYLELTIDRNANGGVGGYYSCQVGATAFDLTGYTASPVEPPQYNGTEDITDFGGGDNYAAYISRAASSAGGTFLLLDDVTVTARNA